MSAFVGRKRELADLRAGLDAAFAGDGIFMLVASEPGIGKTRLANEFASEAIERGARVLRGGNFEDGGAPPYWPWVQVLRAFVAEPLSTSTSVAHPSDSRQSALALRELVPQFAVTAGLEPDLARFRLFDSVAHVLQTQCTTRPLVILLDDLQWADESSLLLLHFLGRDIAGTRMVLLGAYRDVEAHHRPEIGRRIAALACDARTVALGGLAEREVAALIQQTTSRPVPDEIGAAVHRATGGNPLFVDELVRSLIAEGRLDESISAARLPLPERVRAVIRRRTDTPDPVRRCETLLLLGENLWKMAEFDCARQIHAEAAELAEALALPEVQARAALGFGGHDISFEHANFEPQVVQLLERALAAIGSGDVLLRASLLARLGLALAFSPPDRARAEALGHEAVEMARRLGDKPTLQFALSCCICATWGPDNLEERLAISAELTDLSREVGGSPNLTRLTHLEEVGDVAGARREAEKYDQGTQARPYLTTTWILTVWRAMTAFVRGRFEDAERLAYEALQLREGKRSANAAQYFGAQLIALRREQGRLSEVVDAIGAFANNPALPIWRLVLAWVYAELDRTAEAERELERVGAQDFSDIPRDMYWLPCMWILAEVVAKLADRRRAETVYRLLRPYRGRYAIVAMAFNGGSLERSLGLLAATTSHYEEAADHFEAALVANEQIGALPWIAHTEHEYARLLLTRGRAVDRPRTLDLLERAVHSARALGMTALLTRAEPLLAQLVPSSEDEALLHREGEYWTVGYNGKTSRVRDARGLHLISLLLRAPGRDIPAAQLAIWPEVPAGARTDGRNLARELGLGMLSDSDGAQPDVRALAEYRTRLDALRDEAAEADRFNDPIRAARAREEMAAIAEHLGQTAARLRKDSERARLAVTKAIRYAVRKVEGAHPPLGRILAATVKTGALCRYDPDPKRPIRWTL